MVTRKSISRMFSVMLIVMFLLMDILPMQTATADSVNTPDSPVGLSMDDWALINALLPTSAIPNSQHYLKASNTEADDYFGSSVSLSGDTLVVGAPYEDSNATGVNGNQADNSAPASGAVYIFTRSGGNWSQQAYLKASNTDEGDLFGTNVSLSGDTLVVGAIGEDSNATGVNGDQADNSSYNSGAAYVFTRTGTVWSQQAYLKASNNNGENNFGWAVSLSGDTLVVGALCEASSATGVNGDQSDISAPYSGAAYVFTRIGTIWSQQAYLKASNTDAHDQFGATVALSGDTLVIGADGEDSNATGVNGDQADNSAPYSGAAYVFTRTGTVWSQQAYLKASNTESYDDFSTRISLSGDTLIVGAYGEDSNATGVNGDQVNNLSVASGAAYVFTRTGATWSQQAYLKASNTGAGDAFGCTVSLSGDTVVVGAAGEDSNATRVNGDGTDNSSVDSGSAYIFTRTGETWSQQAYLKATNTGASDFFGSAVSLSGDAFAISADFEDSNAAGVNGDGTDNSAVQAGTAYIFSSSIFTDVPYGYWANNFVESLYNAGITSGCSAAPLNYCPATPVTRAQAAVLLVRAIHGAAFVPPTEIGVFADVPVGSFGANYIEQLAADGITTGCGGSNYCPNSVVTRTQIAILLVRAVHGIAFVPPLATGIFADVPTDSFGANYIEQVSADGITSGCGNGNYCPNAVVTRAQMAVLVVKAFNLP